VKKKGLRGSLARIRTPDTRKIKGTKTSNSQELKSRRFDKRKGVSLGEGGGEGELEVAGLPNSRKQKGKHDGRYS